jgi:transposase
MANINRSVISSKIRQWGGLPLTYLHDNAAYAQSAVAMAPLKEAGIDVFENKSYPPYSPDLNPIENAWALVKRAAHRRQPKTMTALRPEHRQALIDSMPNRLRAVIDTKGGSTKY